MHEAVVRWGEVNGQEQVYNGKNLKHVRTGTAEIVQQMSKRKPRQCPNCNVLLNPPKPRAPKKVGRQWIPGEEIEIRLYPNRKLYCFILADYVNHSHLIEMCRDHCRLRVVDWNGKDVTMKILKSVLKGMIDGLEIAEERLVSLLQPNFVRHMLNGSST